MKFNDISKTFIDLNKVSSTRLRNDRSNKSIGVSIVVGQSTESFSLTYTDESVMSDDYVRMSENLTKVLYKNECKNSSLG